MLTSIQLTECGQDDHVALADRVEALAALLRGVRVRDGVSGQGARLRVGRLP